MAWCPVCKNEYREGIKVCSECGVELVEELNVSKKVPVVFGEKEQIEAYQNFLLSNQLADVSIEYDENEGVYELFVLERDLEKAKRMILVYQREIQVLAEENNGLEDEISDSNEQKEESLPIGVYQSSMEKAQDSRSSAWVLLLVGTVGLVLMVLSILNILPVKLGNSPLFTGTMIFMFGLFIVSGFVSMKSVRVLQNKALEENALTEELKKWCAENLKAENIDALTDMEDCPDEVLYFKRIEIIKNIINNEFMQLDQAFLDQFIDTIVYDMVFRKDKEEIE